MIDQTSKTIERLTPVRSQIELGDARTILAVIITYNGLSSVRLIERVAEEGIPLSRLKAGMALLSREGMIYQSRLGIWYPTY